MTENRTVQSQTEVICTTKYVGEESEWTFCSRYNSVVPSDEMFVKSKESGFEQEAKDLSEAFSKYKLFNRRHFLSFEDIVYLLHSIGYRKDQA